MFALIPASHPLLNPSLNLSPFQKATEKTHLYAANAILPKGVSVTGVSSYVSYSSS